MESQGGIRAGAGDTGPEHEEGAGQGLRAAPATSLVDKRLPGARWTRRSMRRRGAESGRGSRLPSWLESLDLKQKKQHQRVELQGPERWMNNEIRRARETPTEETWAA